MFIYYFIKWFYVLKIMSEKPERVEAIKKDKNSKIEKIVSRQISALKGVVRNRVALTLALMHFHELALRIIGEGPEDKGLSIFYYIFSTVVILSVGRTTSKHYDMFLKRIPEHEGINEDEFLIAVSKYKEGKIFGYCEQQGIYLAAKKLGYEKEFFELKKKHTKNLIPNF